MKLTKGIKGLIVLAVILFLASCIANTPDPDPIEENYVSIIFDTGTDEVNIETITGKTGSPLTLPNVPDREGFRFSHWILNGIPFESNIFPETTIILEAVWSGQYMIMLETGQNGEDFDPIYLFEGEDIVLPTVPNKVVGQYGYQFIEWLYEGIPNPFTKMPQMDITLTVKWQEGYAVIFNTGDSETEVEPLVLLPNATMKAPNVQPQRNGFIFTGWSYNGVPYIFDKMPFQTITLTATWLDESNPYNVASTLPKVFINLKNNKNINDVTREDYVDSSITISNTEDEFLLTAVSAEFKGRGNGSWVDSGPKKGYRIKFFDKQSLFGEPKSKHWVILASANFNDVSLAKTKTAFDIGKYILYGIEYTSSTRWVEIYVNGNYHGVYTLAEHVRVDSDRVNVDSQFGVLDTGYLVEYDSYATGRSGIDYFTVDGFRYPFTMKSPDPEDYLDEGITEQQYRAQVNYIKSAIDDALTPALNKDFNTFQSKVDIDSFVDMYILNELFKNTDLGFSSFFMYKKPGDTKIYAGPPWDFDATAGASRGDASPSGIYVADTIRNVSEFTANYIFINLMQTQGFRNLVYARWQQVSALIKTQVQTNLSETFITENRFAFGRNFRYWSPNYTYSPNQVQGEENWAYATRALRNWLVNRIDWLDDNWK
ncbi:CotH kinase family protein [Acholeplasma equirhinis]|uniref:CotH kinase family protein n=1 Tax=Acholeplasma equirhinis TaxID=555393 RepID=UPI00197AE995|nr:CotH kinase family protein [Acholeplasma equirhinis]MBN3489888.1 CotH kinase family protein [Acholeplasma equirhinis]